MRIKECDTIILFALPTKICIEGANRFIKELEKDILGKIVKVKIDRPLGSLPSKT